jgi:hypothetical protein
MEPKGESGTGVRKKVQQELGSEVMPNSSCQYNSRLMRQSLFRILLQPCYRLPPACKLDWGLIDKNTQSTQSISNFKLSRGKSFQTGGTDNTVPLSHALHIHSHEKK